MTPEEYEAYMESIPEWKRGALTITDQKGDDEETKGFLKRLRGKVGDRLK